MAHKRWKIDYISLSLKCTFSPHVTAQKLFHLTLARLQSDVVLRACLAWTSSHMFTLLTLHGPWCVEFRCCLKGLPGCLLARAAITKHHRPGALNNRNLFPPSSGGWKSNIKVLARLVSPAVSRLPLSGQLQCSVALFSTVCPNYLLLIRNPVRLD